MIDDIIEEVGEDNVLQVVTDNVANYKAAGDLLVQKWKQLNWTPCAAHCIDLMLEDFEKKIQRHNETIAAVRRSQPTFMQECASLLYCINLLMKVI
jgi:hypothetical protein